MGDGTGCDNMTAVIVQIKPPPEEDPVTDAGDAPISDANKNETANEVESSKRRANSDVDCDAKRTKTEHPDFPTAAP